MKIAGSNALVLNGAVALIAGASFLFAARAMLVEETATACSVRYGEGTRFAIDDGGRALSASDLQGQANGLDWGLGERVKVSPVEGRSEPFALEVELANRKGEARFGSRDHRGAGFMWLPRSAKAGQSACLSYSVYLQDNLDMQSGVELPGLVGLVPGEEARGELPPAFSARVVWQERGALDVVARTASSQTNHAIGNDRGRFDLKPGRWLNIEQELIVNTPGNKDGVVRVWVDGELRLERATSILADDPKKTPEIAGVVVGAGPLGRAPDGHGKAQKVWISAPELRWAPIPQAGL
ncbi:MAG: hypothetical protein R3D68_05050 [Hyphomicrobiaceae bacterium]